MEHAHHFLSRLDRLSRQHLDVALSLYRDHERVRYLLDHARLPEGAERVAVSLDDPHEGPFVLVTRTGRFVTCLGRGMRADNLPIVTRGDFDALSAKHRLWRARDLAAKQLVGDDYEADFLFGRLLDAGPWLSREEFQALAALHPLIGDIYPKMAVEWALVAQKVQRELRTVLLKRGPRLRPYQLDKLEVYWKTFFAAGHLAVLSMVDEGERIRGMSGGEEAKLDELFGGVAALVTDGGNFSRTVRGTWALGQFGSAWIPRAKERLARATTAHDVLGAAASMLAIGARDPEARPEVLRAFNAIPELPTEEARSWATFVCMGGVELLGKIESLTEAHLRIGAKMAVDFGHLYPLSSPHRYQRPEDVPADIAFAHPFHVIGNFMADNDNLPAAVTMMVQAARATPEQLYLPRRCVEFLEHKWTPELSMILLDKWLEHTRKPAPRPVGPARQGPCPCGSGKKLKRCCEKAAA